MQVIADYPPSNVYNMDEIGLYCTIIACLIGVTCFTDEAPRGVRGLKCMKGKSCYQVKGHAFRHRHCPTA